MGAEAIKELLARNRSRRRIKELREDLKDSTGQKRVRINKKIRSGRSIQKIWKQTRMDDIRCYTGNSSRIKTYGST